MVLAGVVWLGRFVSCRVEAVSVVTVKGLCGEVLALLGPAGVTQ